MRADDREAKEENDEGKNCVNKAEKKNHLYLIIHRLKLEVDCYLSLSFLKVPKVYCLLFFQSRFTQLYTSQLVRQSISLSVGWSVTNVHFVFLLFCLVTLGCFY